MLHRERIALPHDATVHVRLEEVSADGAQAAVLAEETIVADGRQPPIPFALTYAGSAVQPGRRYGIQAEIRAADGEVLFATTAHHPVLAGSPPPESVTILAHSVGGEGHSPGTVESFDMGRTCVFDCTDGVSFTVRTGDGQVELWLPQFLGGRRLALMQTPAASGARYQEGDTVYWNRGEEAFFEVSGQRYAGCRSNWAQAPWEDAARRGVSFRALGQEPGWTLEIRQGHSLLLVTDYGARRVTAPYHEPTIEAARTTYRTETEAHRVTVVIDESPCTDTMSGEVFEAAVTVALDGRTLRGCGRSL